MSDQLSDARVALSTFRNALLAPSNGIREALGQVASDSGLAFGGLFIAAVRSMLPPPWNPEDLTRLATDLSVTASVGSYGPRDFEALIRATAGESYIGKYLESDDEAALIMLATIEACLARRAGDEAAIDELTSEVERLFASLGPLLPAVGRAVEVSGFGVLDDLGSIWTPSADIVRAGFLDVRRWPISPAPPRSLVGTWLLSAMMRDQTLRAVFEARKAETGFRWHAPDLAFVKLAFDTALLAFIEPTGSVRDAMQLARATYVKFGDRAPKLIDLEAVVRCSVGDPTVSTAGITSGQLLSVYGLVLTYICDLLDVSAAGASGLLTTVEALSIAGGWEPVIV